MTAITVDDLVQQSRGRVISREIIEQEFLAYLQQVGPTEGSVRDLAQATGAPLPFTYMALELLCEKGKVRLEDHEASFALIRTRTTSI